MHPTSHLVVIGDFGRDAGLRFCSTLAQLERRHVNAHLPEGVSFFDEHRRLAMTLVNDLAWIKAPWLVERDLRLDDTILVGFDGGLSVADVTFRLAALAFESMAGPLERGAQEVIVALPCNTLAPAALALRELMAAPSGIEAALEGHGVPLGPIAARARDALAGQESIRVHVPTVPGAVLDSLSPGVDALLPLGTAGVPTLYREAAARRESRVRILEPTATWQRATLDAITASVAGNHQRARGLLRELEGEVRARHGDGVQLVEACTDLDTGIGIDSSQRLAEAILAIAYSR